MYAVRNIRLCTKDCLCLYVCPTGATDTEDGRIDRDKCLRGCRACVDACPSHAISLAPEEYPEQQGTGENVKKALGALAASKMEQERIARVIGETSDSPPAQQLARALAMSNRIMAEDLMREAGFLLPQSAEALALIKTLAASDNSPGFPGDAAAKLIDMLENR